MEVHVDDLMCQNTGLCTGIAPEVFELKPGGRLAVILDKPGPELYEDVRDAVRSCPMGALSVVDQQG